jgi:hypothetical protein
MLERTDFMRTILPDGFNQLEPQALILALILSTRGAQHEDLAVALKMGTPRYLKESY